MAHWQHYCLGMLMNPRSLNGGLHYDLKILIYKTPSLKMPGLDGVYLRDHLMDYTTEPHDRLRYTPVSTFEISSAAEISETP
jgi:hypothetical protein